MELETVLTVQGHSRQELTSSKWNLRSVDLMRFQQSKSAERR